MRPAMMLLLRALVILGAVLAVISCGFATALDPAGEFAGSPGGGEVEECTRMTQSESWATVPAAGSTVTASTGAGLCR